MSNDKKEDGVSGYSLSTSIANMPSPKNGRREFLRYLSIGAGSAIVGGAFACGRNAVAAGQAMISQQVTSATNLITDHSFWKSIEESFVRYGSFTTFNVDAGTIAPQIALDKLQRKISSSKGSYTALIEQRSQVGSLLGASVDDIALVNGATEGFMHALTGLSWRSGDVIFYTDHEHPNIVAGLKSIEFIFKVQLVKIVLPTSPGISAEEIAASVDKQIRRYRMPKRTLGALVWSSPTYQTGVMLPIRRMAEISRKHGLVSFCDAAHLMGMASIDFSELDIDFLATCGHKWQCGPSLTGAVIRNPRASALWISAADRDIARPKRENSSFGNEISYTVASANSKFDSLLASCAVWEDIGQSKIEAYSLALGGYLKSEIVRVWGEKSLRSSLDAELLSGITSFDPFVDSPFALQGNMYTSFSDQLRDRFGMQVKVVTLPTEKAKRFAIRVSTPLWISDADVDNLIEAMRLLSKEFLAVQSRLVIDAFAE
ncbi:isopenicillin-N epimerase [Janthinobacterium sp. CG_23.3]|uniref:aminotransferase class V-fold PLP-dependent enzyme n=1 Tax=Janthinobacterium sp. CG_23.3 TaxID=3349634 RepID=UPI0038D3EDC9